MDLKFTQSLKMNAIPEWWNYYMSYENLTQLISKLQQNRQDDTMFADEENTRPLQELDSTFLLALNTQLEKVVDFFTNTEATLHTRLDSILNADPWKQCQQHDSHIEIGSNNSRTSTTIHSSQNSHDDLLLSPLADLQKKQLGDLYILLVDLTTFVELNWTGFDKILCEYDKQLDRCLHSIYLTHLRTTYPFLAGTMTGLCNQLDKLLQYYAYRFCDDNIHLATRQMNGYYSVKKNDHFYYQQHDHLLKKQQSQQQLSSTYNAHETYQMNDLILDNDNTTKPVEIHCAIQSHPPDDTSVSSYGYNNDNHPTLSFSFCGHVITIPAMNFGRQHMCFLLSVIIFVVLLNVDCFGNRQENACFALLVFAALMWATEAIPLYATSLGLPFLIVILGVMRNEADGSPMSASMASHAVFASMFNGTIVMLLAAFGLASALGKYGIARAFAIHVLSRAGTRPRWILLAIMIVAGFLSMWISNVATPVLCFSLIEPMLDSLAMENGDGGQDYTKNINYSNNEEKPKTASSSPSVVASCLVLGIALASCIGGMTSPISSPQNIITLQYMNPNPGWGIWFVIALPISILCIFICWLLLLLVYRPDQAMTHIHTVFTATEDRLPSTPGSDSSLLRSQVAVMLISILTIALWCTETTLVEYLGSTGIVATLPLFLFFGTGLLDKDDLNGFLWSVIVLAQGGMALGESVTSSGLLQDIVLRIKGMIDHLDVMVILVIFSVLILVFATFVSHTVAALIIIPIVQQIGQQLPVPHPNLLVMGAGLACSAGMAAPVSGFPNMTAINLEDKSGKPYLTTKDFLVTGLPTSIFCCVLVVTMGYGVMMALGF